MMPGRVFARVDTSRVPDESTICQFCHWLERYELTPTFLVRVRDPLKAHGLIVQTGPIVDAPIISAPRSTKNKARQRDPEMKSTKKAIKGTLAGRPTWVRRRTVSGTQRW